MRRAMAPLSLAGAGALLCLLVALLLAPRIAAQRQAAAERALFDLLPAELYDDRPLDHPVALPAGGLLGNTDAAPGYQARRAGMTRAVLLPVSAGGYEGPIRLWVAIDRDGRLVGVKVLEQHETPGLGDLARHVGWLHGLRNRRPDSLGAADQIAGATVTSRAVTDALQRALRFFDAHRDALLAGDTP